MEKVKAWAMAHPVELGIAVFGIGILLLWWFGYFSGGSSNTGNSDVQAYYNAEGVGAQTAAQENIAATTAGDQLAATQAQFDYLTQAAQDAVTINDRNQTAAENIAAIQAQQAETLGTAQAQSATNIATVQAQSATNIATVQANAQKYVAAATSAANEYMSAIEGATMITQTALNTQAQEFNTEKELILQGNAQSYAAGEGTWANNFNMPSLLEGNPLKSLPQPAAIPSR